MEDIRARKDTHGRFNHPGDLGMKLIAERFWQHIEKRVRESAPKQPPHKALPPTRSTQSML